MAVSTVPFVASMVLAALACSTACSGEVAFTVGNDNLFVRSERWSTTLDAKTGAVREITDETVGTTLLVGGENLWVIQRLDGEDIVASQSSMTHRWDNDRDELTLTFTADDADVRIVCHAHDQGPAWQAEVVMKHGTMIGWRFPDRLQFEVEHLREFIFPEQLGLAFKQPFFQPGGAGVVRYPLGPKGLLQVTGERCQMRPVADEIVQVVPGADAGDWLPAWCIEEMQRWRVTANRCPLGEKHNLALIESEHGCWLSGYRLGGWGCLLRFGGRLGEAEYRPQFACVTATLERFHSQRRADGDEVPVPKDLAEEPPSDWKTPPKKIAVFMPKPTNRPGVRLRPDPGRLPRELSRQPWVQEADLEVALLQDPADVREALVAPREWFAIINTCGEGFPAESPQHVESMLQAVRDYVRDGGVWWEAGGGYSFYHAIVPSNDMEFQSANRHFCDFAAIDSTSGRWSIYGVQAPDAIFIPPSCEISATGPVESRHGRYGHHFQAYASQGDTTRLPLQQMVLGRPHREALTEYGRRNGFVKSLEEKATPELAQRLKRSILLKVTTNSLQKTARVAEQLPHPVVFHIAEYLHGGFDKQYPDHLPPNPKVGTSGDLSHLIQCCRKHGHAFMPYTNPTWWCDNPKGPTFERFGDAAVSRGFDGSIYPESYGATHVQGYTTCAWHPAVRAANETIRRQFSEQYPVDVLFQDQIGARRHRWDANPAAPHPGAYLEGIHRIADVASKHVPLGTEDGHDRLINTETIFCGLSWPWLPNRPSTSRVLFEDLWPTDAWRIEPLALFLAHDKVLFYHHDLGGFVRDRRDLSLTLAMGYGLSWWTHTDRPSDVERDWIERLCRIQAAVGPRCAGRPLDEFEYLSPEVIRSRWGDLEVIANMTDAAWMMDDDTKIAPQGFIARSPDLEAGIFANHARLTPSPRGAWLLREKGRDGWSQWSAAAE